MSPLTSPTPFDPSAPMTPQLRSAIAYRRAHGRSWEELAGDLKCDPDALRYAAEADPEFAAAQERAWTAAAWEGEADGMRRLRKVAAGEGESATRAAMILFKYAHERRRDATRVAIQKMRVETRAAGGIIRAERVAGKAADRAAEAEARCPTPPDLPPAKGEPRRSDELSQDAVEVLQRIGKSLGKNQAEREGFSDRSPSAGSRMEQLLKIIQERSLTSRAIGPARADPCV
jgi:hypothetical protein